MTTDVSTTEQASPGALDEFLSGLEEISRLQRDPSVPEGTYLGSTADGGVETRYMKQASMVHFGGKELPERVQYWHNGHNQYVMLATAMVPQLLAERMANGQPTFTRHKPDTFTERVVDMELQCPVVQNGNRTCLGIGNGNGFYSEDDRDAHMEALHPREAGAIRRNEERARQTAADERQNKLAEAMLAVAEGRAPSASTPRRTRKATQPATEE